MLNLILEFHFGSYNEKTIKVIRLFFPFSLRHIYLASGEQNRRKGTNQ